MRKLSGLEQAAECGLAVLLAAPVVVLLAASIVARVLWLLSRDLVKSLIISADRGAL